ncbi:hypothetical protein BLNAU_165 [Blattamonas nauphoetae]|uniref:Uncharacterized protein n=1 Tax=Blattamonas nauphoetae TaxID=2049346 RepID=A0ABQ9YMJ5_9EUKA|nr:hypothetical protein BLNAU_165 [Blattamonas nauphoetae]
MDTLLNPLKFQLDAYLAFPLPTKMGTDCLSIQLFVEQAATDPLSIPRIQTSFRDTGIFPRYPDLIQYVFSPLFSKIQPQFNNGDVRFGPKK